MKLSWERTLIAGQTKPYDFTAKDGDRPVGRIYRHDTSVPNRGHWYWTMYAVGQGIDRGDVNCTGMVSSKTEAAQLVERTYAVCLEKGSTP